jgi:branched-chain amino acid transport system ATP-binding protein
LRSILGIVRPRQGQISFNGQSLVGREIFDIARQGMPGAGAPRHLPQLSVEET